MATVREVIEQLQDCNPDADVVVSWYDYGRDRYEYTTAEVITDGPTQVQIG